MKLNRTTWMAAVLGTVAVAGMVGCGKGPAGSDKGSARISASVKLSSADVKSVCVTVTGSNLAGPLTVPLTGSGLQYGAIISDLPVSNGNPYTFVGNAYDTAGCTGVSLYSGTAPGVVIAKNQTATVVLDMNQVAPANGLYNEAPVIVALTASTLQLSYGDTSTVSVAAYDPDAAQTAGLVFAFTASNGCTLNTAQTHAGADSSNPSYAWITVTAPNADAVCHIQTTVTDASDPANPLTNTASLDITVAAGNAVGNAKIVANLNTCPVMQTLTGAPLPLKPGTPVTLTGGALDPDADAIAYTWTVIPNATGTPSAGQTCVGTFTGANTAVATFTLDAASTAQECTFDLAITDGTFADGTAKCTIHNHLSLPVYTDLMSVEGYPILGLDYQQSATIASGQTVCYAIQVKGGCKSDTIDRTWSATLGGNPVTVSPSTPAALGLPSLYTDAACITGTSSNPPAPQVTFTATCHSIPTLVTTHPFATVAINDACNGQADGFDCTAAARQSDKCVLQAKCQAGSCTPVTGQVVTCTASTVECKSNTCDPTDGVCKLVSKPDGSTCTDNNKCTTGDTCSAGTCVTTPVTCANPAGFPCVTAACDGNTGLCANSNAPSTTTCNDNLVCTETDHCDGNGSCTGTAKSCPAGYVCIEPDGCQPKVCSRASWGTDVTPPVFGVAADGAANVWTAGALFGSYNFGNGKTLTAISSDAFLVKTNAAGTVLESWNFGEQSNPSSLDQKASGVAVASNNNVGIFGTFKTQIDFTSAGVAGVAGTDYLSPIGGGLWGYYAIFDAASTGTDPTVKAAHMADLGSTGGLTAIGSNPTQNAFVLCGSASKAVPVWAAGGTSKGLVTALSAYPAGSGLDIVVAKVDATTGNLIWGKQFNAAGDQACNSATIDGNGDVVIAGNFTGTLAFGGTAPSITGPAGQKVLFVAKLKGADGSGIAAATFGQQGTFTPYVAVDKQNNVGVVGQMTGVGTGVTFGATTVPYAGGLDLFAARLSSALVPTCAMADGDSYDQVANGVSFDSAGNMFVAGGFIHNLPLLGKSNASITALDGIVFQLDSSCAAQCVRNYGDVAGTQNVSYITVANAASVPTAVANSIFIAGAYSSQMTNLETTPLLDTGTATLIHSFEARLMP